MENTRTKILNAASDLLLDGGVAALSVRAIAKEAGISTIGIYSHFKGKQGLLDALYIEGFNFIYDAMDLHKGPLLTHQQLTSICSSYLHVGEQHEAHYRLIFGETHQTYQPSEIAIEARGRTFNKLVSIADAYIEKAQKDVSKHQLAIDLWAILHGYISISHHTQTIAGKDWKAMALNVVSARLETLPGA